MDILAAVAGLAILCLTAIVLKMLADGREQIRLLAPQIRVTAPPKAPALKDEDEAPVTSAGTPSRGEAS